MGNTSWLGSEQDKPNITESDSVMSKFDRLNDVNVPVTLTVAANLKIPEVRHLWDNIQGNIQSARLQRIMLKVAPYSSTVIYKKDREMSLADLLSRFCDTSHLTYDQE